MSGGSGHRLQGNWSRRALAPQPKPVRYPKLSFLRNCLPATRVSLILRSPQMFAPPGTGRLGPNAPRACAKPRALPRGFAGQVSLSPVSKGRSADSRERDHRSLAQRGCVSTFQRFNVSTLQPPAGFTLLELLIVVGIIGLLLVLIAPAFTTIKGAGDVTSAAYTIKGVLDTARTYAKANNTYVWVGFYEENVANPASPNSSPPSVGRVILSIVASNDGTAVYNPSSPGSIDPTKLSQVGKLTKIENVHLYAGLPNSATPFQYPVGSPAPSAQYTFRQAIQFSPSGEARANNNSNSLQTAAQIRL